MSSNHDERLQRLEKDRDRLASLLDLAQLIDALAELGILDATTSKNYPEGPGWASTGIRSPHDSDETYYVRRI